jgi:hypothetical protein
MPFSSVLGAQSIVKPGVCTSGTRPAVPFDGQMIYETDTDRTLVWNGAAWYANWNSAWGKVALATSTTNQSGVSTVADITGMSVTFTAVAGRQYRTTLFLPALLGPDGNRAKLEFADGSNTTLMASYVGLVTYGNIAMLSYVSTGSGSLTYKARITMDIGVGTLQLYADSISVRHLLVEDIGPA